MATADTPDRIREAERFAREILPAVSRTFALSVQLLRGELGRSVLCAYLLCRIADTIEDDGRASAEDKARLLEEFLGCLDDAETADAFPARAAAIGGDAAHVRLLRSTDRVCVLYRSLPAGSRERVAQWVREMGRGMAVFALRHPGGLRIQSLEEYREYCYYVASVVGLICIRIFGYRDLNAEPLAEHVGVAGHGGVAAGECGCATAGRHLQDAGAGGAGASAHFPLRRRRSRRLRPMRPLRPTIRRTTASGGHPVVAFSVNTYVPGPWAFLRYVPILGTTRMPTRFAIVAFLIAMLFVTGQSLQIFYQIPFAMVQMIQAIRESENEAVRQIELATAGPQVSVRESRRVKGTYVITEEDAMDHVFGFCVLNDTTARDIQQKRHGGQWWKGKSLDGHAPMGPWIVTANGFDWSSRRLVSRVNGVVKQDGNTSQMYFKVPRLIHDLSLGQTLEAGDVISTGTPEGVGFARTPPEFLKAGDILETEIAGIGLLRNRIG